MTTGIRLKLVKAHRKKRARVRFDVCELRSGEIRRKYSIEVKNRFEALRDLDDPQEEQDKV